MNFKLALAGVLIAGSAVGLAMPLIVGDRLVAASDAAQIETAQAGAAPLSSNALALTTSPPQQAGWEEGLTLRRAADGHFYADVSVDGQSAHMLIDTGASVIALTGDDAAAMGLSWDEADVAQVAQGANGPVYGVQTVLPHVELGGFEAHDVPALIVPQGLFVSLLGQSFLSKVRKVEITGDTMMMSN